MHHDTFKFVFSDSSVSIQKAQNVNLAAVKMAAGRLSKNKPIEVHAAFVKQDNGGYTPIKIQAATISLAPKL